MVIGGSAGIGAAFSTELAQRGCHVAMVGLDGGHLDALATRLRAGGTQVRTLATDLSHPASGEALRSLVDALDVGLVVWNAAHPAIGAFHLVEGAALDAALSVNVNGPVALLRHLMPRLVDRGRGGVVLMSSLAAGQGTARLATYSATKAFTRTLAEGLWAEYRPLGVDVIAVAPGATDTPAFRASAPAKTPRLAAPESVAHAALDGLGRGPVVIPGRSNQLAAAVLQRLLPRRSAIALLSRTARSMYPDRPANDSR